ncbi:MAG TPA: creatininase family protein, partial [Desulfobacterales bacterium]|nr:creatininase family protein [Desulfobacterales bacterium]
EWLRPDELSAERGRCPLAFLPVGPLEYHGPHLPLGTDAISAGRVAFEACRALGRGVVFPTVHVGTDREREPWQAEILGFAHDAWFVGMDFPTARWKSHYASEHVFAIVLANDIEGLLAQGYRVVAIVNGHGAVNHQQTIQRLCTHYSHDSGATVCAGLAFPGDLDLAKPAGHADLYETSLMLHHAESGTGRRDAVDLAALPPRQTPIRYPEFSIVDGPGFTRTPPADRVVRADPRAATREYGTKLCAEAVAKIVAMATAGLAATGSPPEAAP